MCNRSAALTIERDLAQLDLVRFGLDVLPRKTIAPMGDIPLVVRAPDGLELVAATFGNPDVGLSTMNARDDRLARSPLWAPMAADPASRGVVLITHGFEPFTKETLGQMGEAAARDGVGEHAMQEARSGKTAWHGVKRRDGQPILVPALVGRDQAGKRWAALVTTKGGPVFSRFHRARHSGEPREVVCLRTPGEMRAWLDGPGHDDGLLRPGGEELYAWWRCPPGCMDRDADPMRKFEAWTPPRDPQRRLF